ncbi:hypothetical protein NQ318_019227, partial [Aromia moschata]
HLFYSLFFFSFQVALNVSLYYEAMCPDSMRFIATQLFPHYRDIANYIDLELVPYGKAIHNQKDGRWEFSCQHGPAECKGNMYQSCALSLNSGAEKDVDFVNCIMRKRNPSHLGNVEFCARRFQLDAEKLKSCANSEEGDRLLAANGDKTWELDPNISFVPTIVYDGVFDQTSQDQSLRDFVAVVCSKIVEAKPTVCDGRRLPKANHWGYY